MVREHLRASARKLIRSAASQLGYEIRKAPFVGFEAAPIFDLAVLHLMSVRGEQIQFVQVGANDGRFGDPLRKYILKHRWRGLLIEPQPELFELLKANYQDCGDRLSFENVAIANEPGTVTLYRERDLFQRVDGSAIGVSSVASTSKRLARNHLGQTSPGLEEITVPAARLDDLIAKHGLHSFDLLQIDTEGHDWQVLQTLSFSKNKPLLIQFEHGHLSPKDIGSAIQHLNAHGYLVHFGGHESDTLGIRRDVFDV